MDEMIKETIRGQDGMRTSDYCLMCGVCCLRSMCTSRLCHCLVDGVLCLDEVYTTVNHAKVAFKLAKLLQDTSWGYSWAFGLQ